MASISLKKAFMARHLKDSETHQDRASDVRNGNVAPQGVARRPDVEMPGTKGPGELMAL